MIAIFPARIAALRSASGRAASIEIVEHALAFGAVFLAREIGIVRAAFAVQR